jgi:hypothetical protein
MVVSLGMLPNLLPGIGLPPDKRSNFLQAVLQVGRIVTNVIKFYLLVVDLMKKNRVLLVF